MTENKSLNKFKGRINYQVNKENKWESEEAINLVLFIVNLISGISEQYEIDIIGKRIQVTELKDCITLKTEAIFGENQWIVSGDVARFARLLSEYTQIWEELGEGDLDLRIISKIKSPDDIHNIMYTLRINNYSKRCILISFSDYSMHKHDCLKVLELVYSDRLNIFESLLNISILKQNSMQIKTLLRKMRNLKSITFQFYKEIHEAYKQLDLQELQHNGVKINFFSCNNPLIKYWFKITADECIILHAHKEIEALNIKAKGDVVIDVCSLDFTYIINNEYLLWDWYIVIKFEIDWELIESKQNIWFPKFENKLSGADERYLILIPLNRIKQVSYSVYLGCKDKVLDHTKYLTNELDNKVCKPLAQPLSLFCLLNEEAKIDI